MHIYKWSPTGLYQSTELAEVRVLWDNWRSVLQYMQDPRVAFLYLWSVQRSWRGVRGPAIGVISGTHSKII